MLPPLTEILTTIDVGFLGVITRSNMKIDRIDPSMPDGWTEPSPIFVFIRVALPIFLQCSHVLYSTYPLTFVSIHHTSFVLKCLSFRHETVPSWL